MLDDNTFGVVLDDVEEAQMCLKKNPRAQVMAQDNGEYVLVYNSADIDLKRAIVRR